MCHKNTRIQLEIKNIYKKNVKISPYFFILIEYYTPVQYVSPIIQNVKYNNTIIKHTVNVKAIFTRNVNNTTVKCFENVNTMNEILFSNT